MNEISETSPVRRATAARKRKRLLLAAMRCIRRLGVRKSTMEEIAAQAGVSRITLYREFGSREALVTEVTTYRAAAFNKRFMARADRFDDLPSMLEAYLSAAAAMAAQNPVTRGLVRGPLNFTAPGTPMHALTYQTWLPVLEKARRQGQLPQEMDFTDAAQWILIAQFTLCKLAVDTGLEPERFKTLIGAYVVPAFAPPAGAPKAPARRLAEAAS